MARIFYGFGVSRISGALQGSVFANSRYGSVVRSSPKRVNQFSTYVNDRIILVNKAVQSWSKLSQSQRLAWDVFAEYYSAYSSRGSSRRLMGYNVFVSLNLNRLMIDKPILYDPPWNGVFFVLEDVGEYASSDLLRIFYMPNIDTRSFIPLCWFTPPVNPGVSNADPFYRYLEPDEISENYASYYQSYKSRFGVYLIRGMRFFYYMQIMHIDSGFLSNGIERSLIFS